MSSLAGAWMALAAAGGAVALLIGCQDQQIEHLQAENTELRKDLVQCEFARTKAKAEAVECEVKNSDCKCVEGDPLCNCL